MSLFDRIYKYFLKHWIITAIILTLSAYWFTFIRFCGKNIGIIDANDDLTLLGLLISIAIFLFSFIFSLIKSFKDKKNEESGINNEYFIRQILSSINSICSKKSSRFLSYIVDNQNKTKLNPFNSITQPKKQIEDLLEELRICLSNILGIKRDDIGISILYKYDVVDKWEWFYSINISGGLKIEELINNPMTSARQIIDNQTDTIFYPDKKAGIKENKYLSDKTDSFNNMTGSIICRNISVERDQSKFVFAILSITTYGQQICQVGDENAKKTILNILLPPFEERIKRELSLAYMKDVLAKK